MIIWLFKLSHVHNHTICLHIGLSTKAECGMTENGKWDFAIRNKCVHVCVRTRQCRSHEVKLIFRVLFEAISPAFDLSVS